VIIDQLLILPGCRHQASDCHFVHLSGNTFAILIDHPYGCKSLMASVFDEKNPIIKINDLLDTSDHHSLGDPINRSVVTERRLRPLLSLPDGEQAKRIKALLFKGAKKIL
jgi:hypothetical protein